MIEEHAVVIKKDVPYTDEARPLRWNIFSPGVAADKWPAVLLYHGGGWRVGERAAMTAACTTFARLGYVAIAPEYRLLGEAPWPAPLTDARSAIRAVRANAGSLGISADHIFLTGYSAGAHLALIASSGIMAHAGAEEPYPDQSESVAGVAAFFPPARIDAQLGAAIGISAPEMLELMSPISNANRFPPTILFCGDEDNLTPPELSLELYQAIRKAGGTADLRLYSNLIHEFVSLPGMMQTTIVDTAAFFSRTVLNKPAFDAALGGLREWWRNILAQPAGQN